MRSEPATIERSYREETVQLNARDNSTMARISKGRTDVLRDPKVDPAQDQLSS
jgi:hypothetical protein